VFVAGRTRSRARDVDVEVADIEVADIEMTASADYR
jgi:hypothetical protein